DIVASKYFRKAGLHGNAADGETSVRQVIDRLATTIRDAGDELGGYFANEEEANSFEAELSYLLVHQIGAFNSPVWFNCGLWHRYRIRGNAGMFAWNHAKNTPVQTKYAFERPQCSACFIQRVGDDLMSIYELLKTEAKLFKYGSGTGSNFSVLRGKQEKLSGGGTSSGLMSFLDVFDRAAGSTKSGGTTRRAAKMVCIDVDHPEVVDFIEWKGKEEHKARVLISGGFDSDFNGEAYKTVSGQNSNNSVRITDSFMDAVRAGARWQTIARTTKDPVDDYEARWLWKKIGEAAWACADPGLQFDTTINQWNTCPNSGRINASNPCSEFMFLDDSACNLAFLNLSKFVDATGNLDIDSFRHAIRVFVIAQDILVDLSSYPTAEITANSHKFRPIGIGYANLGTLLMLMGIPYDSDRARAIAAAITAILTGEAYATSAEISLAKGPFQEFAHNRDSMLLVMNMHRDAISSIDPENCLPNLIDLAVEAWDRAVDAGVAHGYRNAQTTLLAPTGTIGLLMDCDTTGIEPEFALVKLKKLSGGGYFKIVNQSVPKALARLGYSGSQIDDIVKYISGTRSLSRLPHIDPEALADLGLTEAEIASVESALPCVFDIGQAFAASVIGKQAYDRVGLSECAGDRDCNSFLTALGLTRTQIQQAATIALGRMTIEGAPHIKSEHISVFDCANRCGPNGKRYLEPKSHIRMMAAVQPFLSGAISKTVNLPNESTYEDILDLYMLAWELKLKSVAVFRDGSKASQPLQTQQTQQKQQTQQNPKGKTLTDRIITKSEPVFLDAPADTKDFRHATDTSRVFVASRTSTASVRTHGTRIRLPKKRTGFTQEARVGGHKVYLRTGEYDDRSLGEIFIDMHKEGATFRSLVNCFSIAVSVGLQYGVPLSTYVDQFTYTRFEPQGSVEGHPNVKFATSIVDYIFRVLGVEYLERYDLAQVPPSLIMHKIEDPTDTKGRKDLIETIVESASLHQLSLIESEDPNDDENSIDSLDRSTMGYMGDAPVCTTCGHITVRNGSCYRCYNCGSSLGCS
ncbi:MAG: adenosylcobalamin-dependent ribonucleoside-diphosphate reductase, partial [Polyangiaceae bacterium]|nr:adenosylcobalamin-dependent ribonucleoside-diphosphate reductase [Polyangiaceae bacterium]